MSIRSNRSDPRGIPRHGGHFNPEFRARSLKVFLGHHLISDRPDVMMVTTLGSCVAACIHDPVAGIGGMNHFLLPEVPETERHRADSASRYGSVAMERLINDLLKAGARRDRLIAKVFGGARVIQSSYDIGASNARFVIDYVSGEALTLGGQDLGGTMARRVHYFPTTGKVMRRLLRPDALTDAARQELHYRKSLAQVPVEGEIELFGED